MPSKNPSSIMEKTLDSLTQEVFKEFGNRKKTGRVSIFIDIETQKVYGVPHGQEHIEYLRENLEEKSKYVPVHFDIENDEIMTIIVGESGVEQGYGMRHTTDELSTAASKAIQFAEQGDYPLKDNYTLKQCFQYVKLK